MFYRTEHGSRRPAALLATRGERGRGRRPAAASTCSAAAPKPSPHEYDLLPRPLDQLFERLELARDPVLLAVPADRPLDGPVPLGGLAGQPFLAPRDHTCCAEMIQRACARAGFVPRVVARASDFGVLLSLIEAGAGVTLVPELAARRLPPGVRLLPRPSR